MHLHEYWDDDGGLEAAKKGDIYIYDSSGCLRITVSEDGMQDLNTHWIRMDVQTVGSRSPKLEIASCFPLSTGCR